MGHWQETPTWPCAWGGCIFAGNSKSGRRKFAYVNIALNSPSQEDRPTVTETHKNKTGSVGQEHPTPCKRATHSCEGWVLDPAPEGLCWAAAVLSGHRKSSCCWGQLTGQGMPALQGCVWLV